MIKRRDFLKIAATVVAVPTTLLEGKNKTLANKLRVVFVNQQSKPIFEAELQSNNLVAKWSVKRKQQMVGISVYKGNKLVHQQSMDIGVIPGDTLSVNLPQEMYERLIT